jgi:hypothetical protein
MITYGYGIKETGEVDYYYITWNGYMLTYYDVPKYLHISVEEFDEICEACNGYLEFYSYDWKFRNKNDLDRAIMTLRLMRR